jgi:hypothetical protein
MRSLISLAALVAAACSALAAVPRTGSVEVDRGLRLIKTSESDPGTWVTDEQKEEYVANRVGFYDITDIEVRPGMIPYSVNFNSIDESYAVLVQQLTERL